MGLISDWTDNIYDEIQILKRNQGYEPNEHGSEETLSQGGSSQEVAAEDSAPPKKKRLGKYMTVFATGAGLFSDGYVNNSIGTASTILATLYPVEYADSSAISNVSSIAFVGAVVGMISFAWLSDYTSRKLAMLLGTAILILFSILAAGSWGKDGSIYGMLAALTAYRFFLGVGVGGEYLASAACAEATGDLGRGSRHRWFIWFTDFMIDFGFVVSSFVPLVLLWICKIDHLTPVWRISLGIGAIPCIFLFFLRTMFEENHSFKENNMKNTKTPYWLVVKYYWKRLIVVGLIWWIYDFSVYSFGTYSSIILESVVPDGDMYKTFGWNVVFNLFYLPGSFLGGFSADFIGPRLTLTIGVVIQAILGFVISARYDTVTKHIGGFVVLFGVFQSLGEFGPGDNIGLIASKTAATPVRGRYYGICAATGKIGAFVGTKVFPSIIKSKGIFTAFYISSALCMFSGFLAFFCLPRLTQDSVEEEDAKFKDYLIKHGYDVSKLGDVSLVNADHVDTRDNTASKAQKY